MKKYIIYLMVLLLLLVPVVNAQEDVVDKSDKADLDNIDCGSLAKQINEELLKPATCWTDKECQMVSWGCPWQFGPCHFSIYSTSEEDRNKALSNKVSDYSQICINSNEKLKARCDNFYKQVAQNQCKVRVDLVCLNGKCATPIDVILQKSSVGSNNPADIYGSREIIEHE